MPPKRRFPEDKDKCSLPWYNIYLPPPAAIPSSEIASADQSLANEAASDFLKAATRKGTQVDPTEVQERRNPWAEEVWTSVAEMELPVEAAPAKKGWW